MTVSKITSPISDNEEIDKINEIIDNLGGGGGGGSLPSQTGHAGEFLTTDGTDASWAKTPTGRNVGELVYSAMPLTDAGLHLLDGSLISGGGIYDEFVQYVAGLVSDYPDLFVTEASWQAAVSANGVCGKFVYDSSGDGSVRLPKITGIIEGTTSVSALGDLVAAGLPNITGRFANWAQNGKATIQEGCLYASGTSGAGGQASGGNNSAMAIDASLSSSIYGNSNTVQPQTIKQLVYMVIANSTKTEIESDIDQIATDLNGKADVDLSNISNTGKFAIAHNSMPSGTYDDLTLGASGTEYTASYNGWFTLAKVTSGNGQYVAMENQTTALGYTIIGYGAYNGLRISMPCRKGDKVIVGYNAGGATVTFRFVRAVGG